MFVVVIDGREGGAGAGDLYLMADSPEGLRLAIASLDHVFAGLDDVVIIPEIDSIALVEDLRRLGWRVCYASEHVMDPTTARARAFRTRAHDALAAHNERPLVESISVPLDSLD